MRLILTTLVLSLCIAGCDSTDDTDKDSNGNGNDGGSMAMVDGGDSGQTTGGGDLAPSDFVGDWSGSWNNTTFDSTGAASMTISVDEGKGEVTVVLDLDGSVFGGNDPDAETFTGTYDANEFTVSATTTLFGEMSLTFKSDGTVSGTGNPNTFDRVEFSGTGDGSKIDLTYEIYDSPTNVFAEGTLSFTKDN